MVVVFATMTTISIIQIDAECTGQQMALWNCPATVRALTGGIGPSVELVMAVVVGAGG